MEWGRRVVRRMNIDRWESAGHRGGFDGLPGCIASSGSRPAPHRECTMHSFAYRLLRNVLITAATPDGFSQNGL
jgi:hypothetical protein